MGIELRRGTFVVLEGMDGTGKTTALRLLDDTLAESGAKGYITTRQPAGEGASELGARIYDLEEQFGLQLTPLARQLLHVACHAEQYVHQILPQLESRMVIMDRCWWSAVACGFYGGSLHEYFDYEAYEALVRAPAQGRLPDLVFLFRQIHEEDPKNTEDVFLGYQALADRYSDTTVSIPAGLSPEGVVGFMMTTMRERGYLR